MEKTTNEKIDYIYNQLHAQEKRYKRWIIIKWSIRLFILIYLYYSFFYLLPGYIENIKKMLTPDISSKIVNTISNIDESKILNNFKSLLNK